MSMLFAFVPPSPLLSRDILLLSCGPFTNGYLYSIGVALVNILVNLGSSAQNSVFAVGSRVLIVSLFDRPVSYLPLGCIILVPFYTIRLPVWFIIYIPIPKLRHQINA